MWCTFCGQDVPGLPSIEDRGFCCARCGETIGVPPDGENSADTASGSASSAPRPAPLYDDWELDEQLRHIERLVESAHDGGHARPDDSRHETVRFDSAHPAATWHAQPGRKPAAKPLPGNGGSGGFLAGLVWLAFSLGTTAFVCGGILLGWSLATGRQELWNVGGPIALAGQIALLVGLVLQLDRLWLDSRRAAAKLDDVDEQLHEIKTATTLLGTSHGSSAAFYAHLADGASPQLLLCDLKSQLDLLAVKLGQSQG